MSKKLKLIWYFCHIAHPYLELTGFVTALAQTALKSFPLHCYFRHTLFLPVIYLVYGKFQVARVTFELINFLSWGSVDLVHSHFSIFWKIWTFTQAAVFTVGGGWCRHIFTSIVRIWLWFISTTKTLLRQTKSNRFSLEHPIKSAGNLMPVPVLSFSNTEEF